MFTSESLQIGSLSTKQMATVAQNILSINVNYSMDMADQLTIKITDPGLEMASNNYFMVGRDLVYETTCIRPIDYYTIDGAPYPVISRIRHTYEISSFSVAQGEAGASPVFTIQAMPRAIQQMKRDKKPGNIGGSGYEFVRRAANKYGLHFVGEKSTKIKGGAKNSGTGQQDSVWDRITSIAGSSQYVVFVADGTMYFGSQKWLMFKWGTTTIQGTPVLDKNKKPVINKDGTPKLNPSRHFIPIEYPGTEKSRRQFESLTMPEISKRENDPMESEGSALIHRDNGVGLRPGMTVRINNIPNTQKYYLITSVSFSEQVTDPVSIEFRTPERLEVNGKKAKIPQLPIGKRQKSEYISIKSNIMQTSTVGMPVFSDTQPTGVSIGTTVTPVGEEIKTMLPNSRRLSGHPINKKQLALLGMTSETSILESLNSTDVVETGNIDMWNRPLFYSGFKETSDNGVEIKCRTLSMFAYSTEVIYGGSTEIGRAHV